MSLALIVGSAPSPVVGQRAVAQQAVAQQAVAQQAVAQQAAAETLVGKGSVAELPVAELPVAEPAVVGAVIEEPPASSLGDRIFLVSTRHLTSDVRCADLAEVSLRIWQLRAGCTVPIDLPTYKSLLQPGRPVVIYVHGNRMPVEDAVARGNQVRCNIKRRMRTSGVDWVYFSWPSEKTSIGISDFREKADRTDVQGLYLAALLRTHVRAATPLTMVGYSFGARVITGSLHALAGGTLAGRSLPDDPIVGADIRVGLIAAAIESMWLTRRGYHGQATQNMNRLALLYNRRDAVLKRYWLLERVRQRTALGYSGPTRFATRVDGSRLPVRSRDCSPSVRLRHAELDYYGARCRAGCDLAQLIDETQTLAP